MTTINLLSTDWGAFECPADLAKLWADAKKTRISRAYPAPLPKVLVEIPDRAHPSGKRYYNREKEILDAVNVIMTTGTMDVVKRART